MNNAGHLSELDLLRSQVADLSRQLAERDRSAQDLREQSDLLRAIVDDRVAEKGELQRTSEALNKRVADRMAELETANRVLQRTISDRNKDYSMLQAALNSTADGMLVVDQQGRVTDANRRFLELWRIPADLVQRQDDGVLLGFVLDQLQDPEGFLEKVRALYAHSEEESFDTIRFKDGRVFERYSCPQRLEGSVVGRIWSFRDVTEHHRAEAAWRDQERLLRTVIETATDAIFMKDAEGRYLLINSAGADVIGKPIDQIIGRDDRELFPSEVAARLMADDRETMSGLEQARFESIVPFMGESRVFYSVKTPHRDRQGKIIGLVGVSRDVTELKQAEERLRQSEERYHVLYDETPTMYFTLATDGTVLSVNQFGAEQLGYRVEELVGHSVLNIFYDEDKETVAASLSECLATPETTRHWEFRKVRKDGVIIWVRETVHVGRSSSGETVVLVTCEDTTERKRVEEELRKSHAFIRQIIDTDPNFIFAKDRADRFTLVNKAVANVYGATVENLIGKTDADFNVNEEEVAFFRQKNLEVMDSHQDLFIPEETVTDSTGRTRWLQTVKRPILDEQGRAIMVLGVATDITERKRMEEALRQRERDLQAALQERERISQDLHDGILQSLFAVGLTLETAKSMMAPRALKTSGPPLDQAIKQLNLVMREIRNFITGLGSDLLQGKDLPTALQHMLASLTENQAMRVRLAVEDRAAKAVSTEQLLHLLRVIQEAVSNCIRHGRAREARVSLKMLKQGVRLSIRDNGRGFNPASTKGSGHGLRNMAARAQKIGGRLTVLSKMNEGTRVVLDLPKEASNIPC